MNDKEKLDILKQATAALDTLGGDDGGSLLDHIHDSLSGPPKARERLYVIIRKMIFATALVEPSRAGQLFAAVIGGAIAYRVGKEHFDQLVDVLLPDKDDPALDEPGADVFSAYMQGMLSMHNHFEPDGTMFTAMIEMYGLPDPMQHESKRRFLGPDDTKDLEKAEADVRAQLNIHSEAGRDFKAVGGTQDEAVTAIVDDMLAGGQPS